MALIGREIVQTRTYIDPTNPTPPDQNYKESFPITVFDAVREDMNDADSTKLSDLLSQIQTSLQGKQPLFPSKSANYIMTYAGVAGAVGAVQMSMNIPWDPAEQRTDRIPTEKAVGELILKLGLVDENGNIVSPDRAKVRYSDIIGRPLIYEGLGSNTDGYIHQKGVTDIIHAVKDDINLLIENMDVKCSSNAAKLSDHISNSNNPHNVTIEQIGAASVDVLTTHMMDMNNPHQVTTKQLGLDKVDNTHDIDKPISNATQAAINELKELLNVLQNDNKGFITDIVYNQKSGKLTIKYHNGSIIELLIPIDGLIDEIRYNKEDKVLEVIELNGGIKCVDISDLFIRYVGSVSSNINISIIGDNETGEQIIHASIVPQSITDEDMADQSVITRIIADQSVTTEKYHDLSITTEKLADQSVTTEKVSVMAITNMRLADRSVNGRVLFSSDAANRVLVVGDRLTDPYFGRINSEMIFEGAVRNSNLGKDAVSADKIADKSVITSKIDDEAVTTDKLGYSSVTNDKIMNSTVSGDKLQDSITIPGTPMISVRPSDESENTEIPDTRWVMDRIKGYINQNHNYGDRSVNGRVLFSSDTRHRILAVLRANSDPVWTQVDDEMMGDNAVTNRSISDKSITGSKINDRVISENHMDDNSISERTIQDSGVTSNKIFTSDIANMVLAALSENGHPVYSQVTNQMMANNSVKTNQIEDRSVKMSKLETSDEPNRILGVVLKGSNPQWMQANTGMIADSAVTLEKIKEVPFRDMILGSQTAGDHPMWTKINGNMILDNEIGGNHIRNGEITGEHIKDRCIESKHILQYSIDSEHIAPGAITGSELFTSQYPFRVLAVTDPYSKALWTQIDNDMIRDEGIHREKLFRSQYPYRVLGATQVGVPPEYVKITNDFIMDDTIQPNKLIRNFTLLGTPNMTTHPSSESNGYDIPDTKWVRDTVADMINNFNPTILFDTIDADMIKDHAVGPTKLFRSIYPGPRVLGVTDANEDPEYILIEEGMIADGSVTTNKIQRDVHLLGSPVLEIRPSPTAKESTGEGSLIPDVQWVLDRIAENSSGNGSATPPATNIGSPADNSVTTIKIQNRAVTGDKLFTTTQSNRVLAVLGANSNPVYTQVNADMMANLSVTARTMFRSASANMILGVKTANTDPEWTKINIDMMGDKSVGTAQLVDNCITGSKIINNTISRDKIVNEAFVDETLIYDNAVSNSKLRNGSVSREKLADRAVSGDKIEKDVVLAGSPTVASSNNYENRSLRNIILSPNAPSGGMPGDIWIRYN